MNEILRALAPKSLTLDAIAEQIMAAKAREETARLERLDLEQQLLTHVETLSEGTLDASTAHHKVKIAFKVTRRVDTRALQADWDRMSPAARKCFTWKADVELKAMRGVQEFLPDAYAEVAKYVEVKPAKPTVSVEGV